MSNLKKIISKNFILFFSLLVCVANFYLLFIGVDEIWDGCFLHLFWFGIVGIFSVIGIVGIIISINPKKQPPKILFYILLLFFIIITLSPLINTLPIPKSSCCSNINFEYPYYLKITKEEKENNYWHIKMESPDFSYQDGSKINISSGFKFSITANPVKNMSFEKFKNFVDPIDPNRDRSGIVWIEKNDRKFFTQTSVKENILDYSLSTLYCPNLMLNAQIIGTENNKKEMQKIFYSLMETLK